MHGETKYYHPYKAHVCSVLKGYHVDPISIPCPPYPHASEASQHTSLLINPKQAVHFSQYIHSAVPLFSCQPSLSIIMHTQG